MDIAKTIRAIREKKGIKQVEMAERLNMERSNYSRLEKRGNDLSINQVIEIAKALETTPFDILFPIEAKNYRRSVSRITKLEEQNDYMLNNQRKIEAFMTLVMELGKGFEGFGITKEVFQKQLDPDGKLEQWAKEKITSFDKDL
ncbi:helix-turn-helix transcriptional regulator [Spirosoma sp. KCTC 42546]|uniref:helix-turn-helix domain-containing protein n=1 Tax=Spirosoma sp. KCTC 42546 TaxID=2520506 RepID=UPI001156DE70|nr:helix-turn-helix transcriptional regulator [Spirosoma sp. KCTC 42546]QDK77762.1 helix-turn-helix transcriptional regulator [Spirosoma sp. KCTC 42546]